MEAKESQVLNTLKKLFARGYVYTLEALAKTTQTSRPTVRKYLKLYTKTTGHKLVKGEVRKGSRGPKAITYGHA